MLFFQLLATLFVLGTTVLRAFSPTLPIHSIRRTSAYINHEKFRCNASNRFMSQVDGESKKEDLTPSKVSEMIEVSFVNACLQLSKGYIDVLKLFIVAVQAAYNMGISPSELVDNVGSCSIQSAGRDLMDEEVRLRTSWIHVVYLVLEHLGKGDPKEIDKSIRSTYTDILPLLVASKERGETFQIENLLKEHADILPANLDDQPMEKAIVSQSLRVAWTTLIVLEEEDRCLEDGANKPPTPRPPIPGAF